MNANPTADALPLDAPKQERPSERLDRDALTQWLVDAGVMSPGASLTVEQFRGGYSNLTYAVTVDERQFVFRRPPFGNTVKTGHDMQREVRILQALAPSFERAPRVVASATDQPALGGECYLMERVCGTILRRQLPAGLDGKPEALGALSEALIETLAALHSIPTREGPLATLGKPEGYIERQVTGWIDRYARAQTDALTGMETMAAFLRRRMPTSSGFPPSLIHNDFKYDNLVLDPTRPTVIRAVLDWEMATVGDPLMDLGTTLGYWVEAGDPTPIRSLAFGPTFQPGSLTRAALVERYAALRGRDVPDPVFFYVFGVFKIAVIIQQIYARFVRKKTADDRFATLGAVVAVLADFGDQTCNRDRLSASTP